MARGHAGADLERPVPAAALWFDPEHPTRPYLGATADYEGVKTVMSVFETTKPFVTGTDK
jgi:hypothetical protein